MYNYKELKFIIRYRYSDTFLKSLSVNKYNRIVSTARESLMLDYVLHLYNNKIFNTFFKCFSFYWNNNFKMKKHYKIRRREETKRNFL